MTDLLEHKRLLRDHIDMVVSAKNISHVAAGEELDALGNGQWTALIEEIIKEIDAEIAMVHYLDDPHGVQNHDDIPNAEWYYGPLPGDKAWPELRDRMLRRSAATVVNSVDAVSTKVVANLAPPMIKRVKVQGLVLGHVQAGKTANYTAVAAKAVDRGYRLVIVLAGIHNNLRDQTQARLASDLGERHWTFLTQDSTDFNGQVSGASLVANKGAGVIIVIKKNATRLKILRNWLANVGEDILKSVPVLLIDDEADQATPNSATKRDEQTAINRLVSEIWGLVVTGSYVGYTATPFANILIDPNDPYQPYPKHFIAELPRSEDYFGAEKIFGREPLDEGDDPDDGLDMVRIIPDQEAAALRPTKANQASFDPEVPDSLGHALRWFVLATAIRRARGQFSHSSMLVHTTHNVIPHFRVAQAIRDHIAGWDPSQVDDLFAAEFNDETRRVTIPGLTTPAWRDVAPHVVDVLDEVSVIVDNGSSSDRLNYRQKDEEGAPSPQTVIAVGGGTLSRGLTLEGLVVSYFARTSNTYDALLQMGRWFGYRVGYEDLPRVYVTEAMKEDFQFLALVEEEIRQEIRALADQRLTPQDAGIRIRQHVGRLSVTSPGKMRHAHTVDLSFNGARLQSFILDELDPTILQANRQAAADLIGPLTQGYEVERGFVYTGVPKEAILRFVRQHSLHERQTSIDADLIEKWLEKAAPEAEWNVVLANNTTASAPVVELAPGKSVGAFTRSPLSKETEFANIKALLSDKDWLIDVPAEEQAELNAAGGSSQVKRKRSPKFAGQGTLVLMMIDKDSQPKDSVLKSRRPMTAPEHLVGYGLIFPFFKELPVKDSGYISVIPYNTAGPVDEFDDESFEEGES